ncbi:hypothetical protein BELL_0368g00060 [Botrytis elliptica]|uniref:2EXR domain-containing protein n=1 Tax=Botrytis elliptica TaxID=278938 RepID=A0A4Z1JVZ9_9HELO|nr:hypothetical protein BELL_0368g00060 [Botrytis elliptica]
MPPPSQSRRTKRTRKNGPGKSNKPAVLPPPISPPSPPLPSPPQQPQDPRYSLTYILNSSTPPIHHHSNPTRSLQSLPNKVRHLIWSYARSRTIRITISDDLIYSRSPSPITFRINRESRSATINHYSVHPHFYILDTQNKNKRIHYPCFDPSVDSVVLSDIPMDYTSALSSTIFGFYDSGTREVVYQKREVLDYEHLDVLQSLHIPARAWDWNRIQRAPRTEIRFRNLTEIVLQGGAMGLRTKRDVKKCREFIRGCFERSVGEIAEEEKIVDMDGMQFASHGMAGNARTANMGIKVPEVRVIMPNGLDHEWMFEEDQLGMESIEERTWVMNFISKVVDGDGRLLGVEIMGADDTAVMMAELADITVVPRGFLMDEEY